MSDLDAEGFTPRFFLFHINGEKRAMFAHEYEALAFQRGNAGDRHADVFYLTDLDGKRVTNLDGQEREALIKIKNVVEFWRGTSMTMRERLERIREIAEVALDARAQGVTDDREWHGYGEQKGRLTGETTWTGPRLKMGERVTVVPKSRPSGAQDA